MPSPLPEQPPLSFLPVTRIIVMLEGQKEFECACDGKIKTLRLDENDIIYAPPYGWSNEKWNNPHKYITIVFHVNFTRFLYIQCFPEKISTIYGPDTKILYHSSSPPAASIRALLDFLNSYTLDENGADAVFNDVFKAILRLSTEELQKLVPGTVSKSSYTFDSIRAYLHEHSHLQINRKTVARHFNLNPCYVSRLFSQKKQSFNGVLTDLRLANARNLMESTQLNIEQIAFRSGFSSAGYFIRVFASKYKMPPGEWRSSHFHIKLQGEWQ